MKKETAVEFLVDNFHYYYSTKWNDIVQQAKEIEKQQIINTWYDCKLSIIDKKPTDADQYYNETFKQ